MEEREGGGGGLINFPSVKWMGGLLERGGFIDDLRYGTRIAGCYCPHFCHKY